VTGVRLRRRGRSGVACGVSSTSNPSERLAQRHLRALRDVATSVGQHLELPAVLAAIIERVCAIVQCERASLFVVDDDGGLTSLVLVGDAPPIHLAPGEGVAGAVARTGLAQRVNDPRADPRFHSGVDDQTGFRTRALLAVPLVDDGVVKGVVEALNKHDGSFDEDDEALLLAVSGELALALHRARVFEDQQRQKALLDRRVRELDLLVELDRLVAVAPSLQAVLEAVVARVRALVTSDGASIALVDARTSSLVYRAVDGEGNDKLLGRAVPTDRGLAGACLATREPVRVADAALDERHNAALSRSTHLIAGPLLALPLLGPPKADVDAGGERAVGVLTVVRARGDDLNAATPFSDDDVRVLTLVAARVADAVIDAERAARAREKEQLEAMGHMLAGIVHDLRTPMTVISGYVQLMAEEADAAAREEQAAVVMKSTEQMTAMIKELLAFARGDSTVLLRKVYLETFSDELRATLSRMFMKGEAVDEKAPEFTFIADAKGTARLDPLKVQRAVVNLVKNAKEAIAATGRRGHIRVSFHEAPAAAGAAAGLTITVDDDGPGLAPEIQAKLFQSFASFGKEGGTGLGLALVKRIAEEHKGGVTVDVKDEGGCRFVLRLPR